MFDKAELYLYRSEMCSNDLVDGIALLRTCVQPTSNPAMRMEDLIEKFSFEEDDYCFDGRNCYFTVPAAAKILMEFCPILVEPSDSGNPIERIEELVEDNVMKANALKYKEMHIDELKDHIEELTSYIADGVTMHAMGRSMHGVNSMQICRYAEARGWVRQVPSSGGQFEWKSKWPYRDVTVREQNVRSKNGVFTKVLVTKEGARQLLKAYYKGELTMKKGFENSEKFARAIR